MSTIWTLLTGGVEKSLADWGVCSDLTCDRSSRGKSTVTLRTTERFDAGAPQWPGPAPGTSGGMPVIVLTKATIYRDRMAVGAGGSIYFQGYFDDPKRVTVDGAQNIQYQIHNSWWLFERNQFKQHREQFNGFDSTHKRVVGASIHAGGTNYKVGDTVTVVGGTGTAAQLVVAAISGAGVSGPVTLMAISNGGGSYTASPATPNSPSGGSGSGLQLDLVFDQAPLLVDTVSPEIYLGENINVAGGYVARWSTGAQVGEVIDWVNECYNPTRRGTGGNDATQDVVTKGTIDPNTLMPITRMNTVFCSDAVFAVLRWEPDAVVFVDDSTVPPTVNVRKLGKWNNATTPPTFIDYTNLAEVSVTITADQEREIRTASAVARQLPGVVITYKSVNVDGNLVFPQFVVDKFPSTVTLFTPEVSSHMVELLGSQISYVSATVAGQPIAPALSSTLATAQAWWTSHDHSLRDPNIKTPFTAVPPATVVDKTGSTIDTTNTFLYELDGTTLPFWLNPQVVSAKVSSALKYDRYVDGTSLNVRDASPENRVYNKSLKLTNIAPGFYRTVASVTTAEVPPQGVAESVYRSLAATQFAGKVTFSKQQLRSDIPIGVRLKLVGPTTTFTNLLVQQVSEQPHLGRTTVTFGPFNPVDFDAWIELARATRVRTTWAMPSGRGDGGSGEGLGSTDQGSEAPDNDSSHVVGGHKYNSVKFQQS